MKPTLNGHWLGGFAHPSFEFDADMQLHEDQSGAVTGTIVWCMRKAPGAHHKAKIGLTAKEFVGGQFDRKNRSITLKTTKIEDPKGLGIDPDEYSLTLSADGKSLAGGTAAHQDGQGHFSARLIARMPPTTRSKNVNSADGSRAADLMTRLQKIESFDDAQCGERPGGFSPNYLVYKALLNRRPPVSISEYSALVEKGSPAAKLYAAMLIHSQDRAAGKVALKKLLTDKSALRFISGCMVMPVTVKEVAQDLLDKGNFLHFPLPNPR